MCVKLPGLRPRVACQPNQAVEGLFSLLSSFADACCYVSKLHVKRRGVVASALYGPLACQTSDSPMLVAFKWLGQGG